MLRRNRLSSGDKVKSNSHLITFTVFGILLGAVGSEVIARMKGPSKHKGISVTNLGTISEESLTAQLDIKGFVLRLRAATIVPGGHI